MMNTLFPVEPAYPNGFRYLPEFISREEEQRLLAHIQTVTLHTFQFQGYAARRRVASFGWDWSFDKKVLTKGADIPDDYEWLLERVGRQLSLSKGEFAELLVTEYPVGSVINWHRDAPPFALIAGISLNADCIFKLRPHAKDAQTRKATLSFPVKRRSLYVMEGEAREAWQHSIAAVDAVRYSVTLRTLRQERK